MGFLATHAFVDVSNAYTTPMGLPVVGLRPAITYSWLPTTEPSSSPIGVGSGGAMFQPLCAPRRGAPATANIASSEKAFNLMPSLPVKVCMYSCTIQQPAEGRPRQRFGA